MWKYTVCDNPAYLSPILARHPYAHGLDLNPHKISVYTDDACWNDGELMPGAEVAYGSASTTSGTKQ